MKLNDTYGVLATGGIVPSSTHLVGEQPIEYPAPCGVALPAEAQPLYRFLTPADTVEATDEFVDDDCVKWNPPDRWSIGRPYHSAFKTARRRIADGVSASDQQAFSSKHPDGGQQPGKEHR